MRWVTAGIAGAVTVSGVVVACVLLAGSNGSSGFRPGLAADADRPEVRQALRQAAVQRQQLSTPQAKRQRQRSRRAFTELSPDRALGAGRRAHPTVLRQSAPQPLEGARRRGLKVARFASPYAAVLRSKTGRSEGVMAMSTLPLRSRDESKLLRMVNLQPERVGDRFIPDNARVKLSIGADVADGVRITQRDIAIVPLDVRPAKGVASADSVFFANSAADSDHIARVTPAGVDNLVQLRASSSPERFRYRIDLPAGGRLEEIAGGEFAVRIDGRRVGTITKPNAWDADHRAIPVKTTLQGRILTLDIAHRGRDIRYPAMLDPNYVDILQYRWYTPGANNNSTRYWAHRTNRADLMNGLFTDIGAGKSLITGTRGNQFVPGGTFAYWTFTAPGTTSVAQAEWTRMSHSEIHNGPAPCIDFGLTLANTLWHPSPTARGNQNGQPVCSTFTQVYRVTCWDCNDRDGVSHDPNVKGAQFGTSVYNSAFVNQLDQVGEVTLYVVDPDDPTVTFTSRPSEAWTRTPSGTVAATGTDPGLGVQSMQIANRTPVNNSGCLDAGPCPFTQPISASVADLNLPDGVNPIAVTARDASFFSFRDANGNPVPAKHEKTETTTVKLDRGPPELSVTGDLRDLAGGIDASGKDTYGLTIAATDGTPQAPRVGVRDVIIKVDNNEIERFASDPACAESCSVTDELFFDTDELTEGPHTFSVEAVDRLGNTSDPISWTVHVPRDEHYAAALTAWRADIERRVDNAIPLLPLSGPMPTPPEGWRNEAECEATTAALRGCYEAIQTWAQSVNSWLTGNLAILSLGGELPDPPTFEYTPASDSTSLDLTRAMRDAFAMVKTSLANPLERLNLAITFHDPVTPTAVMQALPDLLVPDEVALTGVYDPDEADISGTMSSPTPTMLSEAIDDLYNRQIAIAQEDIADLQEAVPPEDADAVEANQQFIQEHESFIDALQARQPFVTGVATKMTLPALLDNLLDLDAAQIVKSVRILPLDQPLLGNGVDILSGTRTNTAVVRSAQRRAAATEASSASASAAFPPGAPRCYDPGAGGRGPMRSSVLDPTPTYWAPSRHSANSELGEEDGDNRLKVHRLAWRWKAQESLAWMCSDSAGDRNVEIEAMVYPDDDERWSDNWESNSARKYTQHNGPAGGNIHQDDIATGKSFPFFDKARFPDFAIVFQSSKEFRYRRLYKLRFVTNEGENDNTSNRVIYSMQATSRATGKFFNTTFPEEADYCAARAQDYKSCMIKRATVCVRHEPFASPWRGSIIDWRAIMGSDAVRQRTVRRSNPSLFDRDEVDEIQARCDPRPPGSFED